MGSEIVGKIVDRFAVPELKKAASMQEKFFPKVTEAAEKQVTEDVEATLGMSIPEFLGRMQVFNGGSRKVYKNGELIGRERYSKGLRFFMPENPETEKKVCVFYNRHFMPTHPTMTVTPQFWQETGLPDSIPNIYISRLEKSPRLVSTNNETIDKKLNLQDYVTRHWCTSYKKATNPDQHIFAIKLRNALESYMRKYPDDKNAEKLYKECNFYFNSLYLPPKEDIDAFIKILEQEEKIYKKSFGASLPEESCYPELIEKWKKLKSFAAPVKDAYEDAIKNLEEGLAKKPDDKAMAESLEQLKKAYTELIKKEGSNGQNKNN